MSLIQEFRDIFAWSYDELRGITPSLAVHTIPVKKGSLPVRQKVRRIPFELRDGLFEELQKIRKAGLIFPMQHTEWCSPVIIRKKKNNQIRLCVDFRELNRQTVKGYYPLPFIDQILDQLAVGRFILSWTLLRVITKWRLQKKKN